jgi:hypothetical protein
MNAGPNYDINTSNKSSETVTRFGYLGTTVKFENYLHEETGNRKFW